MSSCRQSSILIDAMRVFATADQPQPVVILFRRVSELFVKSVLFTQSPIRACVFIGLFAVPPGARRPSFYEQFIPYRAILEVFIMHERAHLETLLNALNATSRALRRDGCGDWHIHGKHGQIFTDGRGWLIVVATDVSTRRWINVKRRLSFCRITQDGDDEGCLPQFSSSKATI
jgi:hypothetical protein